MSYRNTKMNDETKNIEKKNSQITIRDPFN